MEDEFGDPVLTPVEADTSLNERLLEFARALNREVCIRAAGHSPQSGAEKRQKREGAVPVMQLDCMKPHVKVTPG